MESDTLLRASDLSWVLRHPAGVWEFLVGIGKPHTHTHTHTNHKYTPTSGIPKSCTLFGIFIFSKTGSVLFKIYTHACTHTHTMILLKPVNFKSLVRLEIPGLP